MKFQQLEIEGFKSFLTKQVVTFPEDAGFYLMSGTNQVDVALEGNGAGKTTIWDALCWCLYGKTARGVKAGNVITWGRKERPGCRVAVAFERKGKGYRLQRTQGPNSLTLALVGGLEMPGCPKNAPRCTRFEDRGLGRSKPRPGAGGPNLVQRRASSGVLDPPGPLVGEPRAVEQLEVEELVGLNYTAFLHSVLMGQFNPLFFDLQPSEKLTLFSEILDLEGWVESSNSARVEAAQFTSDLTNCEHLLATIEGQLKAGTDTLADLKIKLEVFNAGQKKDQAKAQEYLTLLEGQAGEVEKRLKKVESTVMEKEEGCTASQDVIKKLQQRIQDMRVEFATEDALKVQLKGKVKAVEEEIAKFTSAFRSGVCPYCKQKVSVAHADAEVARITGQLDEINQRLLHQRRRCQKIDKALTALRDDRGVREKELTALNADYDRACNAHDAAECEVRSIYTEVTKTKQKLKDAQATNPYAEMHKRTKENLILVQAKQVTSAANARWLLRQKAAAEYWVKGFKDLRLWIIDLTLRELEVETNNSLSALGLEGWSVRFEVERETKAGGVSRGFTVFIRSPMLEGEVPWETWSGGETQRLRIASAMGLAELIRTKRGIQSNLEVWDEPTAHLSEQGITDLLEWFRLRAQSEQRQVWLVDHRSLDYGDFEGECHVEKTSKGSTVAWR